MVGIDIVKIDRIEELRSRDRFIERIFTNKEREYIKYREFSNETIAGIFAAKEAVVKLLGTGFGELSFEDIEILHNKDNKPYVHLSKKASDKLKDLELEDVTISISNEREYAIAVAMGENKKYKKIEGFKFQAELAMSLLKRDRYGHKGNYGKVGIIGGSRGMSGSVVMASRASFRSGSGLVYLLVPASIEAIVESKCLEQIVLDIKDDGNGRFNRDSVDDILSKIKKFDAIAIGPGMGLNDDSFYLLKEILKNYDKDVIIDADGLNALAKDPSILEDRKSNVIVTPHEMEMSRLTRKSLKEIKENRIQISLDFAKKYNLIVLLKGAETIITNGDIYYINNTGNPGMATAGSGDILTGIILSFVGQGYRNFLAARLGAYIHGLAGDMSRDIHGESGMIASDIIGNIGKSVKILQEIVDDI